MRGKNLIFSCAAVLGLSVAAYSQSVDVAFGTGDATPNGAAYLGAAGDQWNEVVATFGGVVGPQALIDTGGSATGITASITCEGAVLSLATDTQPLPALTNYYAFNNMGGSVDVSLTGLGANQAYQLALYVSSDDASNGDRSITGSVTGASTVNFTATGDPQTSFVNGENMVLLNVVSDSAGNMNIVESDGVMNSSQEVDLNGLQLTPTPAPEPTTMSLLGLGLVTAWRRRKRSA